MKDILQKFGFSENETELYFALLELNEASIEECLKVSKIKRSTAYNVAKTLVERGVIAEIPGQPLRYQMLPPKKTLRPISQNRIAELRQICEKLPEESDKFIKSAQATYEQTPPKIEQDKDFMLIHGSKLAHDMMKKYLAQVDMVRIMHRRPFSGQPVKGKNKPVPFSGMTHFLFETANLDNPGFSMMVQAHMRTGRFEYAHLPSLPTQMVIYGDVASLVAANDENVATVVSLSNEMVQLHLSAFESLWEKAIPLTFEDIENRKELLMKDHL